MKLYSKRRIIRIFENWPAYLTSLNLDDIESRVDFEMAFGQQFNIPHGQEREYIDAVFKLSLQLPEERDLNRVATNIADKIYARMNYGAKDTD